MQRKSNIELLRIVSMLAVIMVHLDGASVGLPTPGSLSAVTPADAWRIGVESLTIVGVNCFTLISGYFGIKAKLSGIVKFTLTCMVYAVGLYTISALLTHTFSFSAWTQSWMVFTHNDLWYVPAYMLLYLLSPMLNSAVSTLSLRSFSLWLGLFIGANIWCGWLWGAQFNSTGYTPVQLIMVYLIGRWISLTLPACTTRFRRSSVCLTALAAYAGLTFLTSLLALWMSPAMVYAYNSPWVILSSVALFICFATMDFSSRTVNTLAKGAFAAYLIHKNPAVWGGFIRPTAVKVWAIDNLWLYTGFAISFTAAIYLISTAADSLRALLFRKIELLFHNEVKIKA